VFAPFARAWGCEVTAISSSPDTREQALALGAHHSVTTRNIDELTRAAETFDFIISTVSADLLWDSYLGALKPQGTLVVVGVPESAMTINALSLLFSEKTISGGLVASREETVSMLDFVARTGIRPHIETFPMRDVNEALDRVRSGDVPLPGGADGGRARHRAAAMKRMWLLSASADPYCGNP
jgi:alcohol/geraniol dehydrogenase (NADP+)